MGRITGQEKAPVTPIFGPTCPKSIDRMPFQCGVLRRDLPGCEESPGRLSLVEILHALTFEAHEFPAAASFSTGDERCGASGIAELPAKRRPLALFMGDH